MIIPDEFLLPASRSIRWALSTALQAVGFDFSGGDGDGNIELPQAERVCFLLVDGLGLRNFEDRSGHARTLRSLSSLEPLTSVRQSARVNHRIRMRQKRSLHFLANTDVEDMFLGS